jgi:Na+/alanine symporter
MAVVWSWRSCCWSPTVSPSTVCKSLRRDSLAEERVSNSTPQHTGIGLAVLLGLVFIGGIKRIAKVADLLVPVKTLVYIGVTLYVIVLQIRTRSSDAG